MSTQRRFVPQRGTQVVLFAIGAIFGSVLTFALQRLIGPDEDLDLAHYRDVRDFVTDNYVREVTRSQLVDEALRGMIASLDDYSRYYDADEAGRLDRETAGRYTGIGVVMKRPVDEGRILFTLPGSPAERAGLRVGDLIVAVGGAPIRGAFSSELLRVDLDAAEREPLRLDVVGLDGAERSVEVEHASLVDPTVRHARMLDEERGVGYLAITSFSHETPLEFLGQFEALRERGMRALVLDLRSNLGGVLSAAVDIARRFVPEGVIVSTEGCGAPDVHEAIPEMALLKDFPLVVLVDESSASASEVLAAALQEHRVATLVGAPTFGKGLVQTLHRFPERGSIAKITTSYYYTPSHRNLERSIDPDRDFGIRPDLEVAIDRADRREIHRHLAEYGPPPSAVAAIRTWEAEEGVVLLESHPVDAQLDAALGLFAGRVPASSEAGG